VAIPVHHVLDRSRALNSQFAGHAEPSQPTAEMPRPGTSFRSVKINAVDRRVTLRGLVDTAEESEITAQGLWGEHPIE